MEGGKEGGREGGRGGKNVPKPTQVPALLAGGAIAFYHCQLPKVSAVLQHGQEAISFLFGLDL